MSNQTTMSFKQQLAENKRKREKFEEFKQTLKQAVDTGQKIEMGKAMIPLILEQLEAFELRYCELVAMHCNNMTVMGSALICLENNDLENAADWLFNTTDQADAHHWQLFDNAQEYYDQMHMPWPSSREEHCGNVVALDAKIEALEPKWEEHRAKSFEGTGIKP